MFWNSDSKKKTAELKAAQHNTTSSSKSNDVVRTENNLQQEAGQRYEKIRSALPLGATIQGKLSFDSAVRIDGKLNGELYSSDTIVFGETSVVDAQVEAKVIIFLGKYTGNAQALETAEIHSAADCSGNLKSSKFFIAEGAKVKMQFSAVQK